MRFIYSLILALLLIASALGQGYRPKAGETVLRLDVEGRGSVYILLHARSAPKAAGHVASLARNGFYNGQRFHRVEKSPRPYLVQTGDPASKANLDSAGAGGSGANIAFEDSGYSHQTGSVGLAMVNDRRDSQFYIMLAPAKFLDGKYTVFGQVVAGMEVVRALERGDRITSASIIGG